MAEDDKEKKKNLMDQIWYHGYRPRRDVTTLLKCPGDWLVRATENNTHVEETKVDIVLSICDRKKEVKNLTIRCENDLWSMQVLKKLGKVPRQFKTVTELIEYYKVTGIGNIKLLRAVPRPTWLIKHDQVKFDQEKDLIGSGNFCNVYKGQYERIKDEVLQIAVKICHNTGSKPSEAREARTSMLHEANVMSYYCHDHVIQMFGVACDHPPIYIVMEYCPGGCLQDHLLKQKEAIDKVERVIYCFETARGMKYLHQQNCVHRDLAARNCLISDKGQIKISDFGLSKLVEEIDETNIADKDDIRNAKMQVPVRWMAPESLKKPVQYSFKTDIWSFGVLCYEVFNDGVKPWPDYENKKVATKIRHVQMPEIPEKTPLEVKKIMERIWIVESTQRPSFNIIGRDLFAYLMHEKFPSSYSLNTIPGVKRAITFDEMNLQWTEELREKNTLSVEEKSKQESPRRPVTPLPKDCVCHSDEKIKFEIGARTIKTEEELEDNAKPNILNIQQRNAKSNAFPGELKTSKEKKDMRDVTVDRNDQSEKANATDPRKTELAALKEPKYSEISVSAASSHNKTSRRLTSVLNLLTGDMKSSNKKRGEDGVKESNSLMNLKRTLAKKPRRLKKSSEPSKSANNKG